MANPIILHCFDGEYNIIEEAVTKLFRNPKGVVDFSTSRDKMFDFLSQMELDNHFMIKHLSSLDIPKLIVRRTLTNPVFEESIETIFKFIIEGTTGTLDERFNLIRLYMSQNMSSEEISKNVMRFMHTMKYHIGKIVYSDDDLDEYSANYLKLLFRTNELFTSYYNGVFCTTKEEDIFNTLSGSALLIYMVMNPNAPDIQNDEHLDFTEIDVLVAINTLSVMMTEKQYRRKLNKILDLMEIKLNEA